MYKKTCIEPSVLIRLFLDRTQIRTDTNAGWDTVCVSSVWYWKARYCLFGVVSSSFNLVGWVWGFGMGLWVCGLFVGCLWFASVVGLSWWRRHDDWIRSVGHSRDASGQSGIFQNYSSVSNPKSSPWCWSSNSTQNVAPWSSFVTVCDTSCKRKRKTNETRINMVKLGIIMFCGSLFW